MTTSDTFYQVLGSSSSEETAVSTRCEAILELGRKLTKELDIDQSVDTLGRWMSHYIAELIDDTENASPEDRPAKMYKCNEVILSLWKQRHEMPNGKRPFEQVEPILRTLESLDPEDDKPRYYRTAMHAAEKADEDSEAMSWLKLIEGLDYSAKILIRYFLTKAAELALDKSTEWVALAEAAGEDDGIEFPTIHIVIEEINLLENENPDEVEKKLLQDRVTRLDAFIEAANALSSEMKQRIHQSSSTQ